MINSVIFFHETTKSHCTVNNLLPDGKMILLVLNTMYWNDNRYSDPLVDQIAESQMRWFSDQLQMAKSQGKKVLVMSHIPPG